MQFRCHNCHTKLSVSAAGPQTPVQCPQCHATVLLTPSPSSSHESDRKIEKKHRKALKRVFDPIPNSVTYLAGILLALLLLSPFWAYLFFGAGEKETYLIIEAPSAPGATGGVNAATVLSANRPQPVSLAEFAGVRLNTTREDLDHRFNLTLQNTRGMQPEIYEARRTGEFEQVLAHFYSGHLKEAWVVMQERLMDPRAVERDLVAQFGVPQQRTQSAVAPLVTTGLGAQTDEIGRKLAGYPSRLDLAWGDPQYRTSASIYFRVSPTGQTFSMVRVQMTDAAWLKTGSAMPSAAPAPAPSTPQITINGAPLGPSFPAPVKISP